MGYIGEKVFEKCKNLKIVGCCKLLWYACFNVLGRNVVAIAEFISAMMIIMVRNIGKIFFNLKQGERDINNLIPFYYYKGVELENKNLAIIRLGAVGREVLERIKILI